MKKVTPPSSENFARIRIIGVGGSGKNVTNYMIKNGIGNVDFIAANTDSQDLKQSKATKKVHLGRKVTNGLGTGMNPLLGRSAAEESLAEINEALDGTDLLFIACGMGGGTGTGAAPVIAKVAKELNILTVAVVTKPFTFEGAKRRVIADDGLANLSQNIDAMVIIPNDNILSAASDKTTMAEAFALSNEVLQQAVFGISQLIIRPGDINIDFADIQVVLENSGVALLGVGNGRGANKAELAVTRAISSPLLETSIKGAKRVLFSIASRSRTEISMHEVQTIAERISESVDPNAKIIFGTSTNKDLKVGEILVTLIATAFEVETDSKKKKKFTTSSSTDASPSSEKLGDFAKDDEDEDIVGDDSTHEDNDEFSNNNTSTGWKRLWGIL